VTQLVGGINERYTALSPNEQDEEKKFQTSVRVIWP